METRPEQPPEGKLIAEAADRMNLSIREAARRAGISYGRWRQIVTGYQNVSPGSYAPVHAPPKTLARMAKVVGVTPERMETEGQRPDAAESMRELIRGEEAARSAAPASAATAPGLEHADIIPAMSPAMKTSARPYRDEIAAALGVASALWGVPAENLRGEQVFGPGDLARQWDYVMDAGLALFPPDGYPVGARAWMVAIAQVRRDEKRAHGGEEAGLCALIRG